MDEVKERRVKIAKLYNAGIDIDIIYLAFKPLSPRIIDNDLKHVEESEVMEEPSKEDDSTKSTSSRKSEIERRRELIAILYGKIPNTKIAEAIGVADYVVKYDIKVLMASEVIKDRRAEEAEKRRNSVAELYGKMDISEIANQLGVSRAIINSDISYLKEHGIIERKKHERRTFKR